MNDVEEVEIVGLTEASHGVVDDEVTGRVVVVFNVDPGNVEAG